MPVRDALDASTSAVRLARSTRVRDNANRAARAASTAGQKKTASATDRARAARRRPTAPRRAARGREQ
jgi:hypothetical protein